MGTTTRSTHSRATQRTLATVAALALAATAALVKPQFGVVLIPIVAAVLIKRHLLRAGSGPRRQPWAPARLARWLGGHQGPIRLLTAFLAAWSAFFVLALPFGMGSAAHKCASACSRSSS